MIRVLLLAGVALVATPAMAQDHGGHEGHAGHEEHGEQAEQPAEPQGEDPHAAHRSMDHSQHMAHEPVPREEPADAHADHAGMDHSRMEHGERGAMAMPADIPDGPPPPEAFEGPAHAADAIWGEDAMVAARGYNRATHGNTRFGVLLAERLEARFADGGEAYLWDVRGRYGTATDGIVFKSEGEGDFGGELEDAEAQLLWGHAIGPWFDLEAGVRVDLEPETTAHAVLGVAGLAPYMIHVDAAAFLSEHGDLTARIEAEHDMRLTQRLVLQPRIEMELSAQDIPQREVGSGLSKIETGLRLRYEFVPEFAPYVGVEYEAATGRTADYIRADGGDPSGFVVLIGLRTWF